ncbi:DUF4232 domain-containing protein [Nocardia sp. NPDC052112]|uniref:DUF4232 domain-containing protein n=1 Tax=Nocardia sp. NPDC052112 TaxID=3155646 RepID=UPI003432171B
MSISTVKYLVPLGSCVVLALAGCAGGDDGQGKAAGTSAVPTSAGTRVAGPSEAGTSHAGTNQPTMAQPSTGEPVSPLPPIPPCVGSQLIIGVEKMSPGAGHRGVRVRFSVVGASGACVLAGYPGVDTGPGGPLLHAERTLRGYMGGLPADVDTPPTVVLDHDHNAEAVVEGGAVDAEGNQCSTYTGLLVTAPNTTDTHAVSTTIDTCTLSVHPVTAAQ